MPDAAILRIAFLYVPIAAQLDLNGNAVNHDLLQLPLHNVPLEKLAADAVERSAGFISLYFGEDVSEEEAQKAAQVFADRCPDAEVAVLSGGQPVYYYIISME